MNKPWYDDSLLETKTEDMNSISLDVFYAVQHRDGMGTGRKWDFVDGDFLLSHI